MTKMTTKNRFFFALVLALSIIGFSASAVLADPPAMYEIGPLTDGAVFSNLCSFPITLSTTFTITGTDFVDKSGIVTRSFWHFIAQDTFTANGNTLVGVPYTYNAEVYWDSNGNPTSWYANGVIEKVPLPDKGIFNPAGRVNITENPYSFVLTPDNGNPGNIAGLCAALAP